MSQLDKYYIFNICVLIIPRKEEKLLLSWSELIEKQMISV